MRVCLERTVQLEAPRVRLREWPGFDGPVLHVPDPFVPSDAVFGALSTLAPRYRVLSVEPRGGLPLEADALDLLALIEQFGFEAPVLVAEGRGCATALVVAAWHPSRIGALVLMAASGEAPAVDSDAARALRDCPPDWTRLRASVRCPVLELATSDATALPRIEDFLSARYHA